MFQLFVLQRVSKMFKGTITGSVKLQRKMFLLSTQDQDTDSFRLNPLLFTTVFVPKVAMDNTWARGLVAHLCATCRPAGGSDGHVDFISANYMIPGSTLKQAPPKILGHSYAGRNYFTIYKKLPIANKQDSLPSWTRMLATQPASDWTSLRAIYRQGKEGDGSIFPVKFGKGPWTMTMGLLMAEVGRYYNRFLEIRSEEDEKKQEQFADGGVAGRYEKCWVWHTDSDPGEENKG